MARTKKNLDNEFSIGVFVLFRSFDDYCYWLLFSIEFNKRPNEQLQQWQWRWWQKINRRTMDNLHFYRHFMNSLHVSVSRYCCVQFFFSFFISPILLVTCTSMLSINCCHFGIQHRLQYQSLDVPDQTDTATNVKRDNTAKHWKSNN